jgi:threonine dehydratase
MGTRTDLPTHADVRATAEWLSGRVLRTPALSSPGIDRLAGFHVLLKAENLQLTGSYKIRGALRAVGRIRDEDTSAGVIAQSTGNHALAVAHAANAYGLRATVVLPESVSPIKAAKAKALGAHVILAGETVDERLAVVEECRAATGHAVVDAYDHPDVVAGQGTASLELIEEAQRQGTPLDALVVPVGGGGGVAGAVLAAQGQAQGHAPGHDIAVYGVEPYGCDSLARSLAAGRRVAVAPAPTLADGLRPTCVGALPFEIARDHIAGVIHVDDEAIAEAFGLALFHANLLVEPSGAASLAGALKLARSGHANVGVLLTGGNVEPALTARLATRFATASAKGSAS